MWIYRSPQPPHLPLCCPGGLTASEEVQQCGSIDLPSPLTSPSIVPVVLRPARRSSNVVLPDPEGPINAVISEGCESCVGKKGRWVREGVCTPSLHRRVASMSSSLMAECDARGRNVNGPSRIYRSPKPAPPYLQEGGHALEQHRNLALALRVFDRVGQVLHGGVGWVWGAAGTGDRSMHVSQGIW